MSLSTWNPVQSKQVREILENATHEERKQYGRLSASLGVLLGLGFLILIAPIVGMAAFTGLKPFTPAQWLIVGSGMALGLVAIAGLLVVQRRVVRNVLVTFKWAKEQGITEETLKLDRWG